MSQATELIGQQLAQSANIKKVWGTIIFNVKDLIYAGGAIGDGTTDDTNAVQAAINDAVSKNATLVFFPPGSYKVTSLTNTSTINFVGDNAVFVGYVGKISEFGISTINNKNTITPVYNVIGYGAKGDGAIDDTAAIQAAIDAAKAARGGLVYFPQGKYKITDTLTINASNIILVGNGGGSNHDFGNTDESTSLIWAGSPGGTMLLFTSISGAENQHITRSGIQKMKIDGNNVAGYGIQVRSLLDGIFTDLYLTECTIACYDMGVVATLGEAKDSQSNMTQNIYIRQILASGAGIKIDGDAAGNTSFNIFQNIDILHKNGPAYLLGGSDNNLFFKTRFNRAAGGTGIGIDLLASSVSGGNSCATNYFFHVSAGGGGVRARNGTYPSKDNHIFFYDLGNGAPLPVIDAGAVLYYTVDANIGFGNAFSKVVLGDDINTIKTAKAAIGSESVRIQNNSGNHVRLVDGANEWGIRIQSNVMYIQQLIGSGGKLSLPNNLMYLGLDVTLGAADSGGPGFRVLRVPN